jgi:hypothetical protein
MATGATNLHRVIRSLETVDKAGERGQMSNSPEQLHIQGGAETPFLLLPLK